MARASRYHAQVSNSAAAVVTADANRPETVTSAFVVNTTGSAVNLTVWVVPSAGSRSDGNKVYDALSVGANSQVGLPLLVGMTVNGGAAIHMQASAATSLTAQVSTDR